MIIRKSEITYYDESGVYIEHEGKEYLLQYGKYTIKDIQNLTNSDILEVFKKGRKYEIARIERR